MTEKEIVEKALTTILAIDEIMTLDSLIRSSDIEELREFIFSSAEVGYKKEMINLIFFIHSERIRKNLMSDEEIRICLTQPPYVEEYVEFKTPKTKYTCSGKIRNR